MSKATNGKATSKASPRIDRNIEKYYARHKASIEIQQQLDRLDPKEFTYQTGITLELKRKAVCDEQAAKFQKLADEQVKQSKAAQKEVDRMEENGFKAFNDARVELLIRQTVLERSLLRAKSRIYPDLHKTLKGTKYEKAPASDSNPSSEDESDVPVPKRIKSKKGPPTGRGPFSKGSSKTKPSGSSSRIDEIDVDDE